MPSPPVSIEYFSHYKKEFVNKFSYTLTERERSLVTSSSYGMLDSTKLSRVIYRRLKSKDPAQNNFYVLISIGWGGGAPILLDLSNGKLVPEFEEKRVLRFPRKKGK